MEKTYELFRFAYNSDVKPDLDLLLQKEQTIPGSIQFKISRYKALHAQLAEDKGMMIYNINANKPSENFVELRFVITGNKFCPEKSCSYCEQRPTEACNGILQTVDVYQFHFTATFLQQFTNNVKVSTEKNDILSFAVKDSFIKIFNVDIKKRNVLDTLLNNSYTETQQNVFANAKIHEMLLLSLETLIEEKHDLSNAKFLRDEHSLNAVYESRDILLYNIGSPLTIKELSRKVAINECYLKKGFKEIFGTTIFDFYQQQRMEHAKYLLYEKAYSVTDVSSQLGYSSISHFSAAFKKHTGVKPCDLLQ